MSNAQALPIARQPAQQALSVLFLGNSNNPLSTSCALGLVESGHRVVLGVHDPVSKNKLKLLQSSLASRGLGFVLRQTQLLLHARLRRGLVNAGIHLRGCFSLDELSAAYNLPKIPCRNPNSPEFVQRVREINPDLIAVAAFGRILKNELIETPRLGCINVHPSLLPRYRGPNPYYWVLANRETKSGVTVHFIDQGIDTGDIILQTDFCLERTESEATLQAKAVKTAPALLNQAVWLLAHGIAPRIPQDESLASYFALPPRGASKF
ncbi:MAG: hypothetical protein IT331_06780 [Anaerolineae bacterium]|nr:hypothetical protein [Anaerolineae bacterium]